MEIVYQRTPCTGLEILSCTGNHHFGKHLHDGYVLWLNSVSAEHYSLRGSDKLLLPGTISIIEPGEIHANHPFEAANRHLRSFYFSQEFISGHLEQMNDGKKSASVIATEEVQSVFLRRKFLCLHEQLLKSKEAMALNIAVYEVFAELLSLSKVCRGGSAKTVPCDNRVNAVVDFIHGHYGAKITLDQLAAIADCTPYHLIRLFRMKKNVSPHGYLTQVRLERAKTLLETGTDIAHAALETGFADQSHLTRSFRKRYGIPPAAYKRQWNS